MGIDALTLIVDTAIVDQQRETGADHEHDGRRELVAERHHRAEHDTVSTMLIQKLRGRRSLCRRPSVCAERTSTDAPPVRPSRFSSRRPSQ